MSRRRLVSVGVFLLAIAVVPVVVLGIGRLGAFDFLGQDDPLGDPEARVDLLVCFTEGLNRFQPDEVVEEVLVLPQSDGSFQLSPGVDGFAFDSTGAEQGRNVLKIDFYSGASASELEVVESQLAGRTEVEAVLRGAKPVECLELEGG